MKSIRSTPSVHGVQGDERIRTAARSLGTDPVYEGKHVLRLTVTRHKGGTWEVSAHRADGSTARRRGIDSYDNAWWAVEDELDAMADYLEPNRA